METISVAYNPSSSWYFTKFTPDKDGVLTISFTGTNANWYSGISICANFEKEIIGFTTKITANNDNITYHIINLSSKTQLNVSSMFANVCAEVRKGQEYVIDVNFVAVQKAIFIPFK